MNGKYFTAHIKDEDIVKQGRLMVEFNKAQIVNVGYSFKNALI
ncbi:MAG: hypothetical protein K2P71_15345 [Lachnospiraceae bacterium]|nr:hypothetical protein [Lachnospiraceae bacterium]